MANSKVKQKTSGKLSTKEKKLLKDLDESIEFIKLHQQGKVKAKSIEDLLKDL